jgi:hypothetical protein
MNYGSTINCFRAVVLAPDNTVDMGLAFANRYAALYRKSDLCIPRNETARPPSSFIHVYVSNLDT